MLCALAFVWLAQSWENIAQREKKNKKTQDLTIVVRFIQSSLITSIPC